MSIWRNEIDDRFKKLRNIQPKDPLFVAEIDYLTTALRNGRDSIPKHDLEKYDAELQNLRESARAKPKRFAFKTKPAIAQPKAPADTRQTGAEDAAAISIQAESGLMVQGKSNLRNSIVYEPQAIKSLHLENLVNCFVLVKSLEGPLYLDNLQDCVVVASVHQLRIHKSHNVELYLGCKRPIMEECRDLKFGPLEGSSEIEGVDDFDWVRSDRNDHWSISPLRVSWHDFSNLPDMLAKLQTTSPISIIHNTE